MINPSIQDNSSKPLSSLLKFGLYSIAFGATVLVGGLIVKVALNALGFNAAAAKIGSALSLVGRVGLLVGSVSSLAVIAISIAIIVVVFKAMNSR